ncbi:MAG TPA: pyridoxamine 5'-phosphate oxidase family protein [Acidimicrobiia bacterium]|nr:pyridoxamine 5'-phosphate oxidase family protein [Acidimicrobiia bacterium]
MEFPHLERLTRAECRQRLPGATVGRLAVPTPNFPTVEPVSFAIVEGELVVAARAGSAADAVPAGTVLSFEADVLDNANHGGWSVVVSGPVEELDDDVVALVRSQLGPWPAADNDRLLLIRSERVTGQRIVTSTGSPEADPSGPTTGGPDPRRITRRAINTDEGFALLARGGQHVGRLVITVGGEPVIFPLNFAVDGEAIVFRTQTGTKLTGITRSLAAFEVDDIDASGQGWTVTFEGLAQEVLDADPETMRERIAAIDLETWPGGDRPHVVRIRPYRVHGTAWSVVSAPVAAEPVPAASALQG